MKSWSRFVAVRQVWVASVLALIFSGKTLPAQVTIIEIPTLGGGSGESRALNSRGMVAGMANTTGDAAQHAFLFGGGIVYDLGTLGGAFSQAWDLNADGHVVGQSFLANGSEHGFLFRDGVMLDLGTLGGDMLSSMAVAINNGGDVVGSARNEFGQWRAFLYQDGNMRSLGTLGGSYSAGVDVNDSGEVVGQAMIDGDFEMHAFLYSNGSMTDLGTLGGFESFAVEINNNGAVIGDADLEDGSSHAFLYQAGQMRGLGTLGGFFSTAVALNDAGEVVGDSAITGDTATHAFIYRNGMMTDLGTFGGTSSAAWDINNRGQVVGSARDSTRRPRAFLWENGTLRNLNSMLPSNSGWNLTIAKFINDSGQIVGVGTLNGRFAQFLLSPQNVNRPPIAEAGPNQTVECATAVTVDGSASSDPDGDTLEFQWTHNGAVVGNAAQLTLSLPLGTHELVLAVSDPDGSNARDSVFVTVADTTAPTVTCPTSVSLSADAKCKAVVPDLRSRVVAVDNCTVSTDLVRSQTPAPGANVHAGMHGVTVTVADASGNSSSCTVSLTVSDVTPPTITCPEPVMLSAGPDCRAVVPDLRSQVAAFDNCSTDLVFSQTPAPGTAVDVGIHNVTVTVADASGNSSSCSTVLTVSDVTPPVVVCPDPVVLNAAGDDCSALLPDFIANLFASDNCSSVLVGGQTPEAGTSLSVGQHSVTVWVRDEAGNQAECSVLVTVADQTAPVIAGVSVSPNVLHPANREMVAVQVFVDVSDNCDAAPVSRIVKISSNEPVTDSGDNTAPDFEITGALTLNLRAERSSKGGGRIYTITVECRDAAGNISRSFVDVTVPKGKDKETPSKGQDTKPDKKAKASMQVMTKAYK